MCIPQPYNHHGKAHIFATTLRKSAICAIAGFALFVVAGCRKAPSAPPGGAPALTTDDVVRQADELYGGRQDLVKLKEAIVALRQAQASDPSNYELAWRLAKFSYYLGSHSPDSTEQDKAFHDGIEAGKLAVQLHDDKPDGHFWLGANYGGNAQLSTLAGLADIEDIKREMAAVIKIDERYQAGSAYLVLGELYLKSPRILGGSTDKAIENLEKGVRLGPDNAILHAHLAQAYMQAQRPEEARRQINFVLTMKPAAGYEPEYNEAVTEVKKLDPKAN